MHCILSVAVSLHVSIHFRNIPLGQPLEHWATKPQICIHDKSSLNQQDNTVYVRPPLLNVHYSPEPLPDVEADTTGLLRLRL